MKAKINKLEKKVLSRLPSPKCFLFIQDGENYIKDGETFTEAQYNKFKESMKDDQIITIIGVSANETTYET